MRRLPELLSIKSRSQLSDIKNWGNSLVMFGDSLATGNLLPYEETNMYIHKTSFLNVANALLYQRINVLDVFCHNGYTITQLKAYISEVLLLKPTYCLIIAGVNDVINSVDSLVSEADLAYIYNTLLQNNIKVIACTIPPYDSASTAQKQLRAKLNNYIKQYAFSTANVFLCDFAKYTSDVTGDAYASGLSDDGIHPNNLGGFRMGLKALYPLMNELLTDSNQQICSANDTSNLLTNALFLTDSNSDGCPDGYIKALGTDGAVSLVDRADGNVGKWIQFTQTAGETYFVVDPITGWSIGDVLRGQIEFEIDSETTVLSQLNIGITFDGVSYSLTHEYKNTDIFNVKGVLQTPALEIPAGTTKVYMTIYATGAFTIRLALPKVEIVG